jgi:hypothetical protein
MTNMGFSKDDIDEILLEKERRAVKVQIGEDICGRAYLPSGKSPMERAYCPRLA